MIFPYIIQDIFYYQRTSITTWTIISTYIGCPLLIKIFFSKYLFLIQSNPLIFFYQVHVNFSEVSILHQMPIFSYTNVYQCVLLIVALQCVLISEGVLILFNLFLSPKSYIFLSYVIFLYIFKQCTNLPHDSYHNFYRKCIW